jgi:hypothetical protein
LTARRGAPLVLSLALLNLGFVSAVLAMARPDGPVAVGPVAQATASATATATSTLPPATEIPLPTPAIGTSGGGPVPTATPHPRATSRAPSTDTEP